ncbi:hypothetical protein [Streptomyces sp. NPDC002785]|uniref:hypothetical protein n=1 Tax=Streptomyces sp. NPDC002785 TaxID=3154543 RepID=UPI00331AE9A3
MPSRKSGLAVVAVVAAFALAGCGTTEDDLFSNLNGTGSGDAEGADAPTPALNTPKGDAPPNYFDNNRVRQPGEMGPEDEKKARRKAVEVDRVLSELRLAGKVGPGDVRPALEQLAGSAHVAVGNRLVGVGTRKAEGSDFGIWIGTSACVTGAVSKDRVWATANGHYLETGCMPPAPAH